MMGAGDGVECLRLGCRLVQAASVFIGDHLIRVAVEDEEGPPESADLREGVEAGFEQKSAPR